MTPLNQEDPVAPTPIDIEEMGFALALFVAAANGKIAPPSTRTVGVHLTRNSEWSSDALLIGARSVLMDEEEKFGDEVPLTRAVSVIWHHYESDQRRQVICSRLVAFYSLMVRSNGALLEPWMEPHEDNPESVLLSSAIVEAVATARLGSSGQFVDSEFETVVRHLAERDGVPTGAASVPTGPSVKDIRRSAHIPVTNIVKELATHLFAFQACVAAAPNPDGTPQFRVLDKLCEHFVAMGGSHSLHPMLSRALLAHNSDFPWLSFARSSSTGAVEGLNEIPEPPSVQEAARGELAVLGSLVELLRCLVGDAVTLQFLRTIWPLASFHNAASSTPVA